MPLERFYRLAEEKKKAIREAALNEFARVPIDKVSINRIIKEADISRGSFYTYFEDKWDVLAYIFEDGQKKMRRFCVENLEKHNGDIWNMLVDFLSAVIEEFSSPNNTFDLIRNVMLHSGSDEMFRGFPKDLDRCGKQDELEQKIYEVTDQRDFGEVSREYFHLLLEVAMSLMAMAVRDIYQGEPVEKVKEDFRKKLEMLRYGVCSR